MVWNVPNIVMYTSGAATFVAVACLVKDFTGGTVYEGTEDLRNKVVIITGANTGIGKETALDLASRNAKVIMACRDMHKCETAREQIVLSTRNRYVYCRKCDLASQESIREFVNRFKRENDKLHILINNAGVMRCPQSYTKDGIEMQLGVNHMGHFLLTNLLLDTLKASAPSRIINVSSLAHARGKLNVEDFNSKDKYSPADAYSQSKLANVLFTRELAQRLKGTGVTVNAVNPGIVDTEINRHMSFFKSSFSSFFLKPFMWPFIKSPKRGAQTTLYAALDPRLENVSGRYFSDCTEAETAEAANDDKLAKWLWLTSEKWTKLNLYIWIRTTPGDKISIWLEHRLPVQSYIGSLCSSRADILSLGLHTCNDCKSWQESK